MNRKEREKWLAQFDVPEGAYVLYSYPESKSPHYLYREPSDFWVNCAANDSKPHKLVHIVNGELVEVKPRPQQPIIGTYCVFRYYREHPLWRFLNMFGDKACLGSEFLGVAQDARDWVKEMIEKGKL